MTSFKRLVLTHANTRRKLTLLAGQILGYTYSKTTESVNLYTTGGVMFPVVETEEQLDALIDDLNNEEQRRDNGKPERLTAAEHQPRNPGIGEARPQG